MNATNPADRFELRFQSLFDEGRGVAFPCDATGRVDLDSLSERARVDRARVLDATTAAHRALSTELRTR